MIELISITFIGWCHKKKAMLLPIKLVCDRRAGKDGTNSVGIQYCYSSERQTASDSERNYIVSSTFKQT